MKDNNVTTLPRLEKISGQEPNSEVHGPFFPHDVRPNEAVSATVSFNTQKEWSARVWRLSPIGLELILPSDFNQECSPGTTINVKLSIGNQLSKLEGLLVEKMESVGNNLVAHIRLTAQDQARLDGVERRRSSRWMCSPQFFPTAIASNPARFNDFIYFKVRDLSKTGMRLSTSLRNKFIIKGMSFDCLMNFPMVSQIKMKFRVENVSIALEEGKEVLSIGVLFDAADDKITSAVSQYLFQFGNISSLDELKEAGLKVSHVAETVEFGFVRTKEEYFKVLELRRLAYLSAGKISEQTTPEDMADAYDARARIVIGKYKGEIVSSARLIFNEFEDRMEQEKYVEWPEHLPRRDEMVEIMRACTRPDFRGTDLLLSMFKFIALTVVQSKRPWIIICATDNMKGLYEKIGFTCVDLAYDHPKLANMRHEILLANVPLAMSGKNISPIYWNIVWREVAQYMEDFDLLELDPLMTVRLAIYRLFKPIASVFRWWHNSKKHKASSKSVKKEIETSRKNAA